MKKENLNTQNTIILSTEEFKNIAEDIECVESIVNSAYNALNEEDSSDKLIRLANVKSDAETFSIEMPFGLIDEIEREIERLKLINEIRPLPKFKSVEKVNYLFVDYLQGENNELLAEALRCEFRNEKGVGIRSMIEVLVEQKLLIYDNNNEIVDAIRLFFSRDIGTRQAIFNGGYDLTKTNNMAYARHEKTKIRIENVLNNLENHTKVIQK